MATTSNDLKLLGEFILKMALGAIILFALYGIWQDYSLKQWLWLGLDVGSGGLVALYRGVSFAFGIGG
ncbi:hypothetical protein VPZ60_004296 [Salmonella enterica]|nr:hypothetical protein [Salmonella enterica]